MCTEKHFCSLQWGHQLRRALSITQFPFPAKGNTNQTALYYYAILNYHISSNIRRLPLSQRTIWRKTQKIYGTVCNKNVNKSTLQQILKFPPEYKPRKNSAIACRISHYLLGRYMPLTCYCRMM